MSAPHRIRHGLARKTADFGGTRVAMKGAMRSSFVFAFAFAFALVVACGGQVQDQNPKPSPTKCEGNGVKAGSSCETKGETCWSNEPLYCTDIPPPCTCDGNSWKCQSFD